MALLAEVCHLRQALRFQKTHVIPHALSLPQRMNHDARSELFLPPCYAFVPHHRLLISENISELNSFNSSLCHGALSQQ